MSKQPFCDYHTGLVDATETRFFEIGLARTGTRSVFMAMNQLGFRSMHSHGGCLKCYKDMEAKLAENRCDFDLFSAYEYSGQVASLAWKQIAEERPDAKFILTTRPIEQWVDSMMLKLPVALSIHGNFCYFKREWGDLSSVDITRQFLLDRYQLYVDTVISFFEKTDRLLVVNVFEEDGQSLWNRLCSFVGVNPVHSSRFVCKRGVIKCFTSFNEYMYDEGYWR